MEITTTRRRLSEILALSTTLTGVGIAALVSFDLILVGPLYLVGMAGLAGAAYLRSRVLRILGLIIAAAVTLLMFNIGLLGHQLLGLSILATGAALAVGRYDTLWLRIAAGVMGVLLGFGPISTVISASIPTAFKILLVVLSAVTLVLAVALLASALTTLLLTIDALALALLTTAFALAVSGMLGLASLGLSGLTQDAQEFDESPAFFVMAFDMLGTRAKDLAMSVLVPIALGIWGIIRLFTPRGYAQAGSYSSPHALTTMTMLTLSVQVLNAVTFNAIGPQNPLNFLSPPMEFVALGLWLGTIVIAWRAFSEVRSHHLPGAVLDVRARTIIGILLLSPAAIALVEFIVNLVTFVTSDAYGIS